MTIITYPVLNYIYRVVIIQLPDGSELVVRGLVGFGITSIERRMP